MEKNGSMWPRDCFNDTLVKKMAAFFPLFEELPEAKVKRFRLIYFNKQPGVDSVV